MTALAGRRGRGTGAPGIGDLFIAALVGNEGAIRLYERRGLRPVMTYLARFAAGSKPG